MSRNGILLILGLLILISCEPCPESLYQSSPVKGFDSLKLSFSIDSLHTLYGNRKNLPVGFELQALLALSHYPELAQTKVDFLVKKAAIPLSSRPATVSLIRREAERRYKVIISDGSLDQMTPFLAKNLPFNAQVAIIGHELAHTSCYREMNSLQVLKTGISYPFPGFRAEFEKSTDRRTIDHGLGWPLLEYAEYVRQIATPLNSNQDWMDRFYMNPDEIRNYMSGLSIYQQETISD